MSAYINERNEMPDSVRIYHIRESRPRNRRLFDKMRPEQKRQLLDSIDSDLWHIDEIIEDVLGENDK